jgi:hypothetical protein
VPDRELVVPLVRREGGLSNDGPEESCFVTAGLVEAIVMAVTAACFSPCAPIILILPSRAKFSISGSCTRYLVLTVLLGSLYTGLLIKLRGKGSEGPNQYKLRPSDAPT